MGKEWDRLNHQTGRNHISFADTQTQDGGGRLRVSTPLVLQAEKYEYSKDSHDTEEEFLGTGSSTHLPNESAVQMSVPNIGDQVLRQSREWYYYQPLNAQEIAATCIFGPHESGIGKEYGYCSGSDGILIRQYKGEYWIVLLSSVIGITSPQAIPQSQWNIDRFQIPGQTKCKEFNPSGKFIDFSKFNISHLDVIWLGGDRTRVAFKYDGILYDAHEFLNAGKWDSPFMKSGSLPVRYRIWNESGTAGGSMKQVCYTVRSEGGNERFGVQQIAKVVNVPNIPAYTALPTPANPPHQPNFATFTPVLVIQLNPTFYSQPNRTSAKILEFEIAVKGNVPILWALLHDFTVAQVNPITWYRVADETAEMPSIMRWTTLTVANNPITNPGHVHDFGFAQSDVKGSETGAGEINTRLIIVRYSLDHLNDTKSDWYGLAVAGDGGVVQSVTAVLKWAELY